MNRRSRQRLAYRLALWASVLGFALACAALALGIAGVVSGLVGITGLLSIPAWCVLFFIGMMGPEKPNDPKPNVMQVFAMGGRE